jgi:hypothetical protein
MRARTRPVSNLFLVSSLIIGLAASACGRSLFGELEDGLDGSLGGGSDGPLGGDIGSGVDTGFGFPDADTADFGGRRHRDAMPGDGPLFPDSGRPGTCNIPPDCDMQFPPPTCPNGQPGKWDCLNMTCVARCEGPQCSTDCDCPPNLACIANGCVPADRNNQCCTNPFCPPGQLCIEPNGRQSMCPSSPDGGPGCINDCDCPPFAGCVNGSCVANMSQRPNQCCSVQPCPPGATCEVPGGGQAMCPLSPPDGGVPCFNDCDCPFDQGCFVGQCSANLRQRTNLCCFAPECVPPGDFCELPGGGSSTCQGVIDGGIADGGGDAGPPDAGAPTPVGAPCMPGFGSCGAIGFCIDESQGFPGGYCSQTCSMGMMCPSAAACFDVGMSSICLDECMMPSDCRLGYGCVRLGLNPQPVCWPIPPSSMNPNGSPVGSACMGDNDCMSGLQCVRVPGGGFPDGYCSKVYCDPVTNPCPSGSDCYAFPGLFSLCLEQCPSGGSQSTCRTGYYCLGATGQPGVCVGM